MPSELRAQLASHLATVGSAPFLFVGSGLSRRYLELPNWEDLLKPYAEELGLNFQQVFGSVNGNLPEVASIIAEKFYDFWWSSSTYEGQRLEYGSHINNRHLPLKIAISTNFRNISAKFDEFAGQYNDEIEALRRVTVDGIITTNWDLMMEQLFPDYKAFVGQEELLFGTSQGIGEIFKIHGCATRPESLVLTSEDYVGFQDRNPYLSARLLSVFVDHPVIFLGYRIGDPNVLALLGAIVQCLRSDNLAKLQDRLIFVERAKGSAPTIQRQDQIFGDLRVPILVVRTDDFQDVYEVLGGGPRRIPARILRFLREQVYQLVSTSDPSGAVLVQDIDAASNPAEVDLVIGIGMRERLQSTPSPVGDQGYRVITRTDLLRDVLSQPPQYDAERIVAERLPTLTKGNALVPVFHYLKAAGYEFKGGKWSPDLPGELAAWVANVGVRLQPTGNGYLSYARQATEHAARGLALSELKEEKGYRKLTIARFLPLNHVPANDLLSFLEEQKDEMLAQDTHNNCTAQFAALVCIWDLIHNAPDFALTLISV